MRAIRSTGSSALRKPHAVVIVTAQTDVLGAREAKHRERLGARGTITLPQQAHLLEGARGSTSASRTGFPSRRSGAMPDPTRATAWALRPRTGWDPVAPGEFVLGYPGEDDLLPYAPSGPLGQGGSYMVLRKLYQDVPAFREYLQTAAGDNESRQLEVAAKMVGRWQDGRSLVTSGIPEAPPGDPALDPDTINRFRYRSYGGRDIDPDGVRCPIGAHVRRANPRDSLGFEGVLAKRHRIIRRGMPYGKPLPKESTGDDADRGLIFVAYQSSIERQFEFIQSRWLNDGDNFWLGEERDFLSPGAGMTVPATAGPDISAGARASVRHDSRRRLLLRARPPGAAGAGCRLLALKHAGPRNRAHPVGGGQAIDIVPEREDLVAGRLDARCEVQRVEAAGVVAVGRAFCRARQLQHARSKYLRPLLRPGLHGVDDPVLALVVG